MIGGSAVSNGDNNTIRMIFEDCGGRPVPRLDRVAGRESTRKSDGLRYFDLSDAPGRFGWSLDDLRSFWTDVFSDLAGRGEAEDLTNGPPAEAMADARRESLRRQRFPHLSVEHFAAFMATCDERRLNPFANEVGADLRHDKRSGLPRLYLYLPINGLRALAHRSKKYIGIGAPDHTYGEDPFRPARTTIVVKKEVNGQDREFTGVAEWDECAPPPGRDDFWDSKPKTAMATRAEADALRKAFRRLANLYLVDELPDGGSHTRRTIEQSAPSDGRPKRRPAAKLEGVGAPTSEIEAHAELVAIGVQTTRARAPDSRRAQRALRRDVPQEPRGDSGDWRCRP
jgi:hypothetical protein